VDYRGGRNCRDSGATASLTAVRPSGISAVTAQWQASNLSEVAGCLGRDSRAWWIAGGWALDLFLGQPSRPHADLDIGVPRRDIGDVLLRLDEWDIHEAMDGILTPLESGQLPRPEVNSLWCRRRGAAAWSFEILLDEVVGHTWVYRRDPRITRLMGDAVKRTKDDMPFLAPEIQLLYKAKTPRKRDRLDFGNVSPRLDAPARHWLQNALELIAPSHEWIALLGRRR
jgi:hypothetical protein